MSLFVYTYVMVLWWCCSFILTRAHKYRLQCYYTEPGLVWFFLLLSVGCVISRMKSLFPLYAFLILLLVQLGILDDIFNVSRYWKSCKYLQPNRWLQSWLRRETQALMQVVLTNYCSFYYIFNVPEYSLLYGFYKSVGHKPWPRK